MKAIVFNEFGDSGVLKVEEIEKPELGSAEVLVEVKAVALNPLDSKIRAGYLSAMTGSDFPMMTAGDFSGVVAAIGSDVTGTAVGEEVFGSVNFAFKGGALAQFVATAEDNIAKKPAGLDDLQASSIITVALTAYQALHDYVAINPDERILINGASGNVGRFAVQFAAQMGLNITASASAGNIELVESLGAQSVFNYQQSSPADLGQKFDVILDLTGTLASMDQVAPLLDPNGRFITAVPNPALMQHPDCTVVMKKPSGKQLDIFTQLIAQGKLSLPELKIFNFSEVKDAHQCLESGEFKGKLVLTNDW